MDYKLDQLNFDYELCLSDLASEKSSLEIELTNLKIHYFGLKFGVEILKKEITNKGF